MFERLTDRSRKVMALANQEAQRLNHEYIGTEHILLGLVKLDSGVGLIVLKNLDLDLRRIRIEVEKLIKAGPESVSMGKLPQTPRAKKVIEYAIEEARNLNHNYVGTEHILLGLIREHDGVAAQVLLNLGLRLEEVREEVLNVLGRDDTVREHVDLSPTALHTTQRAHEEALTGESKAVGSKHLLFNLLSSESDVGVMLASFNLKLDQLREKAKTLPPEYFTDPALPTQRSTAYYEKILKLAAVEAIDAGSRHVEEGHFILGALHVTESDFIKLLQLCDVNLDTLREKTSEVLKSKNDQVPPAATPTIGSATAEATETDTNNACPADPLIEARTYGDRALELLSQSNNPFFITEPIVQAASVYAQVALSRAVIALVEKLNARLDEKPSQSGSS